MMNKNLTIKQKLGNRIRPLFPFSDEVFNILRFEFRTFRVRNNLNLLKKLKIRRTANKPVINLNIAAGPFGDPEWVNIDISRYKNISFTYDCRKKIPFKDNSVDRIRAEHVFEHFSIYDEAPKFLEECYRVLKPGAVLRIIVPNAEKYLRAYCSNDDEAWTELGYDPVQWGGAMFIINHVFRQGGEHKFAYDYQVLNKILMDAGFTNVVKMRFGKSMDELLVNDLPNHKSYSLYIDSQK